ncbi:hypothetical protein L7F22_047672 [Adiantum nelumboides]|nr:hypothetical protein [Adiantum nelumboides]
MYCLLWLVIVGHAAAAAYLPLPPAIQCNGSSGCTVENYQGIWVDRKPCKAAQALYPTSEVELFNAVALASRTGSKVKVVGSSHSYNKLVCPGGDDGIIISTQHLNSLIHVNVSSLTVTTHAGVQLRDLVERIAEFGLTLPHSPVWHGVSMAGMISTGAHGSGLWHRGSSTHDYVVGMRLITPADEEEGFAKIIDLSEQDEDLNAAKLSLGVLGAISQVTFQLEPMFKRSASLEVEEDTHLDGDGIVKFAKEHEFGEIWWYPFSGKALFKVIDRVDADTVGDGANNMVILDRLGVDLIESLRRGSETAEESGNLGVLCQEETKMMNLRQRSGDGFVNSGKTFTGYPVVGLNHRMQTSGGCEKEEESLPVITPTGIDFNPSHEPDKDTGSEFVDQDAHLPWQTTDDKLETCMWNPTINGLFVFDTAISVPISRAADAVADIKRLRDMNPEPMCSLGYIGGIWIRFLAASSAYLAGSTESIMFELVYYRARDPFTPRLHQDLFEEIEQILVNKYGGRPHWGKNRDLAFANMRARTVAMEKFLDVRQRFDPSGLLSSEWSDAILGIQSLPRGVQTFQDHCALEGLCVCKDDSHCHPTKGYFCRPGLAYEEARVCRYETRESSSSK